MNFFFFCVSISLKGEWGWLLVFSSQFGFQEKWSQGLNKKSTRRCEWNILNRSFHNKPVTDTNARWGLKYFPPALTQGFWESLASQPLVCLSFFLFFCYCFSDHVPQHTHVLFVHIRGLRWRNLKFWKNIFCFIIPSRLFTNAWYSNPPPRPRWIHWRKDFPSRHPDLHWYHNKPG